MTAVATQRSFRSLVAAALLLLLCCIAAVGYTLGMLREASLSDAERDAGNVSHMLAEQMLRSVQSIDLVLTQIESEFGDHEPSVRKDLGAFVARPLFQTMLGRHLANLSHADVICVFDAEGRAVASTRPPHTVGGKVTSGLMIDTLRTMTDSRMVMTDPKPSVVTGRAMIYFARRLGHEDGSFAGAVVVGVELTYFNHLFRSIETLRGMASLLARDTGEVLTGSPGWRVSGEQAPDLRAWRRELAKGGGVYLDSASQGERMVVVREVPGLGLAVATAVDRGAILAVWRHRAAWIAVGTLVMALIAGALLASIGRQFRALMKSEEGLRAKEAELAIANRDFDAALNNLPVGVCVFDGFGRVSIFNEAYRRIYGLADGELKLGASLQEVIELRLKKGLYAAGDALAYRNAVLTPVLEAQRLTRFFNDGRVLSVSRMPMPGGGRLTLHEDVTEAHRAQESIRRLAELDSLTQLANRTTLDKRLEEARARLAKTGEDFAVFILDLDNFKPVNDTLGHAIGDLLLKEIAARLERCAGPDGLVARFGGDEFVLLLRRASTHDVADVAARILAAIRPPCHCEGHELSVGVSIGVFVAKTEQDAARALQRADLALYAAKRDGRNAWRAFDPEMESDALFTRQVEIDLEEAIASNALEVHYQPIVEMMSRQPVGAEALLRWTHPTLGAIGPDRFVTIAEERGLIGQLGYWVLSRACAQAAAWPHPMYVSVNLSPRQFKTRDVIEDVSRVLADTGLPPHRLALEITETVLLDRSAETIAILRDLRAMGVRVKLDDFGAGYSSLAYLREFRVDVVKIDRSFIAEIETRAENAAIVEAISGLARTLGIKVVAEGVETEEQRQILLASGCHYAQGYLFSRPLLARDLPSVFRTRHDERAA